MFNLCYYFDPYFVPTFLYLCPTQQSVPTPSDLYWTLFDHWDVTVTIRVPLAPPPCLSRTITQMCSAKRIIDNTVYRENKFSILPSKNYLRLNKAAQLKRFEKILIWMRKFSYTYFTWICPLSNKFFIWHTVGCKSTQTIFAKFLYYKVRKNK